MFKVIPVSNFGISYIMKLVFHLVNFGYFNVNICCRGNFSFVTHLGVECLLHVSFSLQSVLDGYNGTVMAYGQTGTGKTYTLGRLGDEDTAARGIMVRALEDILSEIFPETDSVCVSYLQVRIMVVFRLIELNLSQLEMEFQSHSRLRENIFICCNYVQLYMETIQDLLDPSNDNISIMEDPKTGDISLPGATHVEIRDQESFLELLRLGEAHRFAANTKLNTESSRSHAILMVILSAFW